MKETPGILLNTAGGGGGFLYLLTVFAPLNWLVECVRTCYYLSVIDLFAAHWQAFLVSSSLLPSFLM